MCYLYTKTKRNMPACPSVIHLHPAMHFRDIGQVILQFSYSISGYSSCFLGVLPPRETQAMDFLDTSSKGGNKENLMHCRSLSSSADVIS